MEVTAKDMMTGNVVGVLPHETVRATIDRLLENGVSGLPVVSDAGRLVGILTEEDLICLLHEEGAGAEVVDRAIEDTRVLGESLYTRLPVFVAPDTPREEIARRLVMRRIKRVPVVDEKGVVVGIVSRRDVLRSWQKEWHQG